MQQKVKTPVRQECPDCHSTKIIYDHIRGESVCGACGVVVSQSTIDLTQEWRAFTDDQRSRRARTGAILTPTKHDQGITTEIGKGRGELFKVSSKKRAQYYRLTKWHKRLIKSRDRNLSFAFSELQRLISVLHLSKAVHEKVAKLYQQAVNKGLVRGRSTESIIAALLYTTCREEGAPRTLDEIAKTSGINKKDIGKTYRYIARKLNIRILPAKAQDYVPRFGSLLNLSERVQVKAVSVLDDASKFDVTSGKGPIGVLDASWASPRGGASFPCVGADGWSYFYWTGSGLSDGWRWLVGVRNYIHSPPKAGFLFSSPRIQPPSILPISFSGSESAIYFLVSKVFISQLTCKKNFKRSSFQLAFCR